jgi:cell wall-associated NlpC family hydrolase
MTPYFSTPDRLARLRAVAAAWIGTPFMPNAAVCGKGVSCQMLAGRVLIEAGALPEGFVIPGGEMAWSAANKVSLIVDFIDTQPALRVVATPLPGDVVGFKIGGCIHHVGVVVFGSQFIHCWRGAGCRYGDLNEAAFLPRLARVWRPMEVPS